MGRKIPGKKHRGIKDPEKQRAERWKELKDKVNAPPLKLDEQTVPKSLERVMKLKDDVKSGRIGGAKKNKNKKKKLDKKLISIGGKNEISTHPNGRPEKAVPVFNQRPNESTYSFWNRVNRETTNFLNETKFEKQYGVSIKRNSETGQVEGVERQQKDEIDELMKLKMKHKNTDKKKKKKVESEPKLTKSQKKKMKLEAKKTKKLEDEIDEFKGCREDIKFGEIAHAPPEFKVRPKKADTSITKPAKKELLLSSLFKKKEETSQDGKSVSTVDKTGKRKNLPSAERRILEKQQSDVVAAYRLMKAQRSNK